MKVFGLVGYPLSHSFSKKFFTGKFNDEGLTDHVYENFELPAISGFAGIITHTPGLLGLNVTIPYKEQVIPYLHWKNEVVTATGACNCIKITNHQLFGYNTDTIGFEQSLSAHLLPHHRKALILGTGGAAKAIAYVLNKLSILFSYVSRHADQSAGNIIRYEDISSTIISDHTLIINTTPLGMYPHPDAAPPLPYAAITCRHYLFDAIYNPEKTLFLQRGEQMGAIIQNGRQMLVIQAEESWKIWNAAAE